MFDYTVDVDRRSRNKVSIGDFGHGFVRTGGESENNLG